MATQRYYERGVGSRTGMRPAAIPADPSAMRAQMESLFRPRQPQLQPEPSSASAMDTAPPSDTPSAAIRRSYDHRRRQSELDWVESADDQPDDGYPTEGEGASDATDEPEPEPEPEPLADDIEDTTGNPPFAPHPERPRSRNAAIDRPASLFTAGTSASKRRKPQPGNYSWLADNDDEDEDDQDDGGDDERVASSLGISAPNPPPSARARPRPRTAKPDRPASPAVPARRSRHEAPDESESGEASAPPKRKAPARGPAPVPSKRAKKVAPPNTRATASSPRGRGRPRKHVRSPSPPTDPESEHDPDPESEPEGPAGHEAAEASSDEEHVPRKRPGRPPKAAAQRATQKAPPRKATASKGQQGRANGIGDGRARSQATSAPQPRRVEERVSPPSRDPSAEAEGLRRGTRHRIKPLEWWRGERAEYGRPSLGKGDVPGVPGPTLRKVYRVNRADGEGTFSGLHFKKGKKGRAPTRRVGVTHVRDGREVRDATPRDRDDDGDDDDGYVELDPTADNVAVEDGMDETTERVQVVWDPDQNHEVERTIACTSMQMEPRMFEGQSYGFEKLLSADDTLAAGVLSVPVGGSKPTKSSKDNNYVFVVIQGAALIKVGRSEFTIAPGGMFLVPRGNTYSIENAAQRELRLFFTQSRNGHSASMALRASVQPRRGTATPAPPALLQHLNPRMSASSISGQATPANGPRRR